MNKNTIKHENDLILEVVSVGKVFRTKRTKNSFIKQILGREKGDMIQK